MTKHNLKHNGAAYNESAELINQDPKVTSGAGRALCTCGWLSEDVANGAQRRAAFKAHKAEATAEAPQQTELVLGQDVAAGTPEDEVAEAIAELVGDQKPAKRAARKAVKQAAAAKKAKPESKVHMDATDPNAVTVALPFTKDIADSFWRFLGRDAVREMAGRLFPTVQVRTDANAHVINFTGPTADVTAAVQATADMWRDAIAACAEWKKTDPEFLARPKGGLAGRKASYFMTGEFYTSYAAQWASA